jgi:hypothetical protein
MWAAAPIPSTASSYGSHERPLLSKPQRPLWVAVHPDPRWQAAYEGLSVTVTGIRPQEQPLLTRQWRVRRARHCDGDEAARVASPSAAMTGLGFTADLWVSQQNSWVLHTQGKTVGDHKNTSVVKSVTKQTVYLNRKISKLNARLSKYSLER